MRGGGGGGIGAAGMATERLSREEASQVVRRFWRMVRDVRWKLLGILLLLVGQTFGLLAGPRLVAYAIDKGMVKGDVHAINMAAIAYLALAVLALILGRITVWSLSKLGETFLASLRRRVFDHMMFLGLDFFDREKTGVLVSRM